MIPYQDLDNDSNVAAYEYGADYIEVQFKDGYVYVYTYQSAGASNIETMKNLADQGNGLNSFIIRKVRNNWESKT